MRGVIKVAALAVLLSLDATMSRAADAPGAGAGSMQVLRSEIRTDKRAIFEKSLDLSSAEAKQFWPLYDGMQKDLAGARQRYNRAVLDYVQAGDSVSSANAERIAKQALEADDAEHKILDRHFRKVLRVLPPKKAARYIQLESRIQTLTRYDIADGLPLVR